MDRSQGEPTAGAHPSAPISRPVASDGGLRILVAADRGDPGACPILDELVIFLPDSLASLGHDVRVLLPPGLREATTSVLVDASWRPDVLHCIGWRTAALPELARAHGVATACVLTLEPFEWLSEELSRPRPTAEEPSAATLARGLAACDVVSIPGPPEADAASARGRLVERLLEAVRAPCRWICNGVDAGRPDPLRDPARCASADCKRALQRQRGLAVDASLPLIGFVVPRDTGSGVDLVASILEDLTELELQLVVLGLREASTAALFRRYASAFPRRLACWDWEGEPGAQERRLYAAADLVLAPSPAHACHSGLRGALRFGAIPIAVACPGPASAPRGPCLGEPALRIEEASPGALLGAVSRALALYRDREGWHRRVQQALRCDLSWEQSGRAYVELYRGSLGLDASGRAPVVPLDSLVPVDLVRL